LRLQFEDGEREVVTARLGLASDATDEDLNAAIGAWLEEEPPGEEDDDGHDDADEIDASEEGVVVIDVASLRRYQQRDRVAGQVEDQLRRRDRDELITSAIADGKFAPSRRAYYISRYDEDPEGTTKLIARLTSGTVPLSEIGLDAPTDDAEQSDAYPAEWAPEVAAREERQTTPKGRRRRVHGEGM
jgi:Mu-like prophage I protein